MRAHLMDVGESLGGSFVPATTEVFHEGDSTLDATEGRELSEADGLAEDHDESDGKGGVEVEEAKALIREVRSRMEANGMSGPPSG